MYDFSHLFPNGIYPSPEPKPSKPTRTPEELAEDLLRWRCSEYAPGVQCHFCEDCKPSRLCVLCTDILEAAKLLKALDKKPEPSQCNHHRITRECPVCGPQPKGAQD